MRIVLCTAPESAAAALARTLVKRRLAACVNRLPGVTSTYRWEGEIQEDREDLLVIKTAAASLDALLAALPELHPYDVPEILAVEPDEGSEAYVAWVRAQCAPAAAT